MLFGLFAYCFYHAWFPVAVFPVFYGWYYRARKREAVRKRKELLRKQFRDGLLSVSSALQVGYSLENAITEAAGEMAGLWGPEADISREFAEISRKVRLNQPVEQAFTEFADRSRISEILLFADVIRNVRYSGGNLVRITRETATQLGEKIRIQQEIQASLASGLMQGRIMCFAPVLILLYIQLTASDLLAGMYGNMAGILVMSGCLLVYLCAVRLMRKNMSEG